MRPLRYCPSGHVAEKHGSCAVQGRHTADLAAEVLPTPHPRHVALLEAPSVPEYVPSAQTKHTLAIGTDPYDPGAQSMHESDLLDPDDVEYIPTAHATHAEAPPVVEYVPAGQRPQTAGEVADKAVEKVPGGQAEQDVALTASCRKLKIEKTSSGTSALE